MIGSSPGKLENKRKGIVRNTWSLFPVLVISSFVCETDKIDICTFPYYKYSSAFAQLKNMVPLRNRLLIILCSKTINVKIAIALVNSISPENVSRTIDTF